MPKELIFISPIAGKRLIGRALASDPEVRAALNGHTVVVTAGTTDSFAAKELLALIGDSDGFDLPGFHRGVASPSWNKAGKIFPGDVVIRNGKWDRGVAIADIASELTAKDIVFKGANAITLSPPSAAVLVGNPAGGTVISVLRCVIGARVRIIIPAGVEKLVPGNLYDIMLKINSPDMTGPRMSPVPGRLYTELEALASFGICAEIAASGGVNGVEGGCWFICEGDDDALGTVKALVEEFSSPAPTFS